MQTHARRWPTTPSCTAYTELGIVGGTVFLGMFYLRLLGPAAQSSGSGCSTPTCSACCPYMLAMMAAYAVGILSLSRSYEVPTYTMLGLAAAYLAHGAGLSAGASCAASARAGAAAGLAQPGFSPVSRISWYAFLRREHSKPDVSEPDRYGLRCEGCRSLKNVPMRTSLETGHPVGPSPCVRPSADVPRTPSNPRRLRIGHVTQGLQIGGQEKLLVEFARHADRDHFDLHFISLGGRGPAGRRPAKAGWPVTTLDKPSGLRPGLFVRLALLFRRLQLDVVHTHDDRPLIYGAPAAWLARTKTIAAHAPSWPIAANHAPAILAHPPGRPADASFRVRLAGQRSLHGAAGRQRRQGADALERHRPGAVRLSRLLSRRPDRHRGPAQSGKGDRRAARAMAQVLRTEPRVHLEIAGDGVLRGDLERLTAGAGHRRARFVFWARSPTFPACWPGPVCSCCPRTVKEFR